MGIFDIINIPLGYLFRYIYMFLQNYGWTLVLFTLITKAILLPLTIKQQKSMSKMQAIQPKLQELQKKYQYDKEKLNQETMKLYQSNDINPMSGCLPLLIQFPVLIALYNIIRSPLTYVIQLGKHGLPSIEEIHTALTALGSTVSVKDQIGIAAEMTRLADGLAEAFPGVDMLYIDFSFFGLNLSQTPSLSVLSPLLLIPVLAGLTTFLTSWLTTKMNGQSTANKDGAAGSMQMMTYFFPLMTVFFSVSLPAGLGFYWIISNIVQIVQQYVMKICFPPTPLEEPVQKHFREREAERRKK
ncbi:MAG: YidC/Oxa1 family membrane protein insertase [Clostridia bacterium]|nr:YidC/Oxa1 family membrane protein insertase [Clostridia bacterium]